MSLQDELKTFEELGLVSHAEMIRKEYEKREIDEMLKEHEYYEVTREDLNKLFMIRWANFKTWCSPLFFAFLAASLLCLVFVTSAPEKIEQGDVLQRFVIAIYFVGAMGATVWCALLVAAHNAISLEIEDISSVKIKLPRGAMINLANAKKKGIFSSYALAYPTVLKPRSDPALLGVVPDGRMFMICYWDIEKDINDAVKQSKRVNLDKFKKFKLK